MIQVPCYIITIFNLRLLLIIFVKNIALEIVSTSLSSKLRIAIFISGSGTNMQAIINYTKRQNSRAEVALIISNVDKVAGLERARLYKIEYLVSIIKRIGSIFHV